LIGSDVLGTRSETKNVNSLRSVERAIRGEMIRHAELLNEGKKVKQETRHFQEDTGLTRSGRSKEQAEDYRYFPEPDLVPVAPAAAWIEELRAQQPERPSLRRKRLKEQWAVPDKEMAAMINADALDIVEETVLLGADPTKARPWWLGEISRIANEKDSALIDLSITPKDVAEIVALVAAGELTDKLARQVVEGVIAGEGSPSEVVAKRGIKVVNDDGALMAAIEKVCSEQAETADKVRNGHVPAAGELTDKLARQVVEGVIAGEGSPSEVVAKRGIKVVNDDGALMAAIEKVCSDQAETADKVRNGHIPAAGALIGAVMKETKGQADAARVRELLLGHLGQAN
jgi:aspartyl-tRNA(Asn)/glutamyl-tRNA(Gln) amidotransferase subunit B